MMPSNLKVSGASVNELWRKRTKNWRKRISPVFYIHTINISQQYRHSMVVPSVTNAQGQVEVSVIQMQWSPEAGAKGTFDQADLKKKQTTNKQKTNKTMGEGKT